MSLKYDSKLEYTQSILWHIYLPNGCLSLVKLCDLICHMNHHVIRNYLINELLLYKKWWQSYEAINKMYAINLFLLASQGGLTTYFALVFTFIPIHQCKAQSIRYKWQWFQVFRVKYNEVRVICLQSLHLKTLLP